MNRQNVIRNNNNEARYIYTHTHVIYLHSNAYSEYWLPSIAMTTRLFPLRVSDIVDAPFATGFQTKMY